MYHLDGVGLHLLQVLQHSVNLQQTFLVVVALFGHLAGVYYVAVPATTGASVTAGTPAMILAVVLTTEASRRWRAWRMSSRRASRSALWLMIMAHH
jgi:hypothetical protein